MRMSGLVLVAILALPLTVTAQTHPDWSTPVVADVKVPSYVAKAMNDPARAADRKDDVRRQMAAVLTFTGVKPGDEVLELVPAAGYWTRVFSQVVGPHGHVYADWPEEYVKEFPFSARQFAAWQKLAQTPHYANVSAISQPIATISLPQTVDIVFTDDNYHDYHDPFSGPVDMLRFDKLVYEALKPGGVFVIVDHMAPLHSGTDDTNTLHRIDPVAVKREVESAGFVFDGSSDALLNPKDPLTISIFDKAIRGHTSQFIYRFKKPAK